MGINHWLVAVALLFTLLVLFTRFVVGGLIEIFCDEEKEEDDFLPVPYLITPPKTYFERWIDGIAPY